MKNNQNIDLTNIQWTDEDDSLFRSFYDSDEDEDFKSSTFRFVSINRNRVENRVSINQNGSNKTASKAVREVRREIEHENDLYENHENFKIDRLNTSVLSSNKQLYSDMFLGDSSSTSMISSRRFTRTRNAFALSFEMIKYDSKKTLFKQMISSKLHQHILEF